MIGVTGEHLIFMRVLLSMSLSAAADLNDTDLDGTYYDDSLYCTKAIAITFH